MDSLEGTDSLKKLYKGESAAIKITRTGEET